MLKRLPIHQIPNGIDTDVYSPLSQKECKAELGIPEDRKVLMFAAANLSHYWKGGDNLLSALQMLPQRLKAETTLLLVGKGGEDIAESAGLQSLNMGYVSSDYTKVICYSAADVFVYPTRADMCPFLEAPLA